MLSLSRTVNPTATLSVSDCYARILSLSFTFSETRDVLTWFDSDVTRLIAVLAFFAHGHVTVCEFAFQINNFEPEPWPFLNSSNTMMLQTQHQTRSSATAEGPRDVLC